jgi:ferredoxin-like protein FixX
LHGGCRPQYPGEELLGTNKYEVDEDEAHIVVDEAACALCSPERCACVEACPPGGFGVEYRYG